MVTAFNAVQYAVDPAVAVAELARVCRGGGRVAIGVWGDPQRCETEGLLTKAGLDVQATEEVSIAFTFDSLDDAWTAHTSAGPLQKVIDVAGADAVREVMDAVLESDRKPDGSLRQDNVMRYVLATKP